MKIEELTPLEYSTLLQIQTANRETDRNPTIHQLLLEIARLHHVVRDLERGFQHMRNVWREDVGGEIVAMHRMRVAFQFEMNLYGVPVPEHPRQAEYREKLFQERDNRRFMENIKVLDNVRKNQTER